MRQTNSKKIEKLIADILSHPHAFTHAVHEVLKTASSNKTRRWGGDDPDIDLASLREVVSAYLQPEAAGAYFATIGEKLEELLVGMEHADPTTESLETIIDTLVDAADSQAESNEERIQRIAATVQESLSDFLGR